MLKRMKHPDGKLCAQCGKQIPRGPNYGKKKFCSQACMGLSYRHSPERSLEIMWGQINKDAPGGCWIWTGHTNNMGYGAMSYAGRPMVAVHRFLYERLVRPLRPEEWCLHKCDVPRCVNPDHIFIGDHKANMADMWRKGRQKTKLKPAHVLEIRAALSAYPTDRRLPSDVIDRLVAKYPVGRKTIWAIHRGRKWRHIQDQRSGDSQ